jgi:hypothetical protein
MGTSGAQLLLVAFHALSSAEQEEAYQQISQARLERLAGEGSQASRVLVSLQLVASEVGGVDKLTSTSYRQGWRRLKERGEEAHNLHAVIKHFGSWRRAREALDLSQSSSARAIEARFDKRRLDKVWRYTGDSLRQALAACVKAIGHVPQVAEYDWWRQRQLELAAAQGEDAKHLPSATPYRRRYGSWEAALLHFGHTPDQVAERLERG